MTFAETMAILGAYEKIPKKEMYILEITEASEWLSYEPLDNAAPSYHMLPSAPLTASCLHLAPSKWQRGQPNCQNWFFDLQLQAKNRLGVGLIRT